MSGSHRFLLCTCNNKVYMQVCLVYIAALVMQGVPLFDPQFSLCHSGLRLLLEAYSLSLNNPVDPSPWASMFTGFVCSSLLSCWLLHALGEVSWLSGYGMPNG